MKHVQWFAVLVCLIVLGVNAFAQTGVKSTQGSPACTASILHGGYGAGSTGLVNTSGSNLTIKTFVPFAEAAHFIFDGAGHMSGTSTADFGGIISPVTFTGTYTVNSDCTGNLTADAGSNGILHRDLVIVDSGKEVEFVSTDAGVVIAGYMKKQGTDEE